jgi:carbamoyl-phosphate synthase large subunit
MSQNKNSVLVTGVGGNVGQGIVRNIRASFPDLRIVTTDIGTLTAAHHFCDAFYQVPYCYEESFKTRILEICHSEKIDIIIPATDYEAYHLGLLSSELPPVIASSSEVTSICLDKLKTFECFKESNIPFAKSCLPKDYQEQWKNVIVKPREGRGSRGIHINPNNVQQFDDSYTVQPLLEGDEITSAFYVTKKGDVYGPVTFRRELSNGMTERCETTNDYDDQLHPLIQKMVEEFPFRGPVNIQGIVEPGKSLIPFEINCRYSGTNSIRTQFGFEDIKYGLQEYLFNEEPKKPQITQGSAIRVFMDVIYPNQKLSDLKPGADNSYIF